MAIVDPFGRPVTQARISLNSSLQCNFSCDFCHKEGIEESNGNIIKPREIERIIRILTLFGISKVKLTGGEPLLRKDIMEIVERINMIGVDEISLSTNGTNLSKMAVKLKNKGLKRVNISLHTLNSKQFKHLTGVDRLDETLKAIKASINAGLLPVKLNTTIMRGINNNEVEDLIEFSRSIGGSKTNVLQLIELVPTKSDFYERHHYPLDMIENDLKTKAIKITDRASHQRQQYELPNRVTIEVVRPMHNTEFCMGCNRIRITYDGKFKPCLLRNNNHIDFLTPLRAGADDANIADIFKKAVFLREPFFKSKEIELMKPKVPYV